MSYTAAIPSSAAAGCLKLCGDIVKLVVVAKHNKHEFRSLRAAVESIDAFLTRICAASISGSGAKALGTLYTTLQHAEAFLHRVSNAGPLVSLLTASLVRQEFLSIHRDLTCTFQILAAGEQLVGIANAHSELSIVQRELSYTTAFFVEQEQAANRLRDLTAAAQQQQKPDEVLHKALLRQLQTLDQISSLSPDDLLAELQALQMAALYGDDSTAGKQKTLGDQTEDFLIQQLCAALAPRAAQANKPLTPAAAPEPPAWFLCPISREVMVKPVMLAETGQTYEAANIQRWLETHNTCPATGRVLSSKMLVTNYSLAQAIQQWAKEYQVTLRPVPTYTPALAVSGLGGPTPGSSSSSVAVGATAQRQHQQQSKRMRSVPEGTSLQTASPAAAAVADLERGDHAAAPVSARPKLVSALQQHQQLGNSDVHSSTDAAAVPVPGAPFSSQPTVAAAATSGKMHCLCRCTRTSWAVIIILGLIAVAAGVSVGAYFATAGKRQAAAAAVDTGGPPAASPSSSNVATAGRQAGADPNSSSNPPAAASSRSVPPAGQQATAQADQAAAVSNNSMESSPHAPSSSSGVPPAEHQATAQADQGATVPNSSSSPRAPASSSSVTPAEQQATTVQADQGATTESNTNSNTTAHPVANSSPRPGVPSTNGTAGTTAGDDEGRAKLPGCYNTRITSGENSVCVLLRDQTVRCWGYISTPEIWQSGQTAISDLKNVTALAINDTNIYAVTSSDVLVLGATSFVAGVSNVTAISARGPVVCTVSFDGLVSCWNNTIIVVQPPDGATHIAVGGDHICAITRVHDIACWARAWDSTFLWDIATPEGTDGIIMAIGSGESHSCALDSSGNVTCWGHSPDYGQTTAPEGLANVTVLAVGDYHNCVVTGHDKHVICWGLNDSGQLSVPEGVTDVYGLALGNLHSCALVSEGYICKAVCWGFDGYGQVSEAPSDLYAA